MGTRTAFTQSYRIRAALAIAIAVAGFGLGRMSALAQHRPAAAETWRIRLGAYPDLVGVGGYKCLGCDRLYTPVDDMLAAPQPLTPLHVVVHAMGDPSEVYWQGLIQRDTGGNQALTEQLFLTAPPPYEVRLLTVNPSGYTLCPNSRATTVLRQRDFDTDSNAAPGTGRNAEVGWYFWSCRAPGGG